MHARRLLALAALAIVNGGFWPADSQGATERGNESLVAPRASLDETEPRATSDNRQGASRSRSEFSGYVLAEGRLFFHDALYPDQEDNNGSLAAQPEYYHQWEDGSAFTFTPFGRLDSADSRRTHWDIRELNYLYPGEFWFFRVGVGRVFWGATEFVHLVDVVNQTDLVEHIDGEDKLGQPMVEFSMTRDWGTLDVFFLPYFRERTFPGKEGRLRPTVVIDTDDAIFENPSEQRTIDLVTRYSRTFGSLDFGIYLFRGTNREPLLVPSEFLDPNDTGEPRLIPFYEKTTQVGADVQWATGNWLWKLEVLYRSGYLDPYFATVGGFEYTFFGFAGSKADVGFLAEYAWDERGDKPETTSIFDNDIFFGMRLTPNDIADTLLLVGFMQDVGESESVLSIEASRRLNSHWRLILDAWFFLAASRDSILYDLRDDDFARLELAYYF